jgi:predicted nucleotidyltransferase
MQKNSIETIVRRLNEAGVRYLIAGGLAVVAHGYVRFTADFDIILSLDEANVLKAIEALAIEDFRPRVPVPLASFADAELRKQWVEQKGMVVFSLWSSKHPSVVVDIFVENPLDFEKAYSSALRREIAEDTPATFVSLEDLIHLKQAAARDKDLIDIRYLKQIQERLSHE